ncbi:MAG: adenylate kinase [Candidatus Cloacimonadota bacterium]|nr:adenylate kinase [Candidatus Cloacimonadota bacterium]
MINIVLFGPPGAGKGTQSKYLIEKYNLVYISTGDMLRKELKSESELGKKVQKVVNSGGLVSDEIIVQLIEKVIRENENSSGFLFDGFPRTYVQAYILDGLLHKLHVDITCMLMLDVSEEILMERLLNRGENRADDTKEVIQNRLKEYKSKTLPVIDYYKEKGIFYKVDGIGEIEDIHEKVV